MEQAMRTRTLAFLILIAATANAGRGWYVMPLDSVGRLQEKLTWTTNRMDTVLRDYDTTMAGPDGPYKKQLTRTEIVPRVVGGYAIHTTYTVDTLHTLALVMAYSKDLVMGQMDADTTILAIDKMEDEIDTTITYRWDHFRRLDTLTRQDTLHLRQPKRDSVVTVTYTDRIPDSTRVTVYKYTAVARTERKGVVTAAQQEQIKRLWRRWGFKNAKINNQAWGVWSDVRASARQMIDVKKSDMAGTEVSRREE
jgi:hypothetical protein